MKLFVVASESAGSQNSARVLAEALSQSLRAGQDEIRVLVVPIKLRMRGGAAVASAKRPTTPSVVAALRLTGLSGLANCAP